MTINNINNNNNNNNNSVNNNKQVTNFINLESYALSQPQQQCGTNPTPVNNNPPVTSPVKTVTIVIPPSSSILAHTVSSHIKSNRNNTAF